MVILRCGIDQRYCPGVNEAEPNRTYYYLFKFDPENKEHPIPEMTGNDLKRTGRARTSTRPRTSRS